MTTLTEFLERRLREDQEAAERAASVSSPRWMANNSLLMYLDEGTPPFAEALACVENYRQDDAWEHAALHDPARVLREVLAKRTILEAVRGLLGQMYDDVEFKVLTSLAEAWRDHPDHPGEWDYDEDDES